jgi:hypothetical protein
MACYSILFLRTLVGKINHQKESYHISSAETEAVLGHHMESFVATDGR